jgi:DNA-directed RNA polymerase subunit beta'
MKDMGYKFAFKGGLSFSLGDIRIPEKKKNYCRCKRASRRNF